MLEFGAWLKTYLSCFILNVAVKKVSISIVNLLGTPSLISFSKKQNAEAYSEAWQTSVMELFCENS